MRFHLFFLITMLVAFNSCVDLRDSDFYPDVDDSRLPRYSEKGYDIAGALINGDAWRSQRRPFTEIMLFDISRVDTVIFEMYGEMIDGNRKGDYVSVYIYQTTKEINSYIDLKQLEDKEIILDGVKNYAELKYHPRSEDPFAYKSGKGKLIFKSIRDVKNITYINSEELFHSHPVYFSGIFELSFENQHENLNGLTKGRFDFKVDVKVSTLL